MGSSQSTEIHCHNPGCRDNADYLAYDAMFNLNIGFCESHLEKWVDVDHIEFYVNQ